MHTLLIDFQSSKLINKQFYRHRTWRLHYHNESQSGR